MIDDSGILYGYNLKKEQEIDKHVLGCIRV